MAIEAALHYFGAVQENPKIRRKRTSKRVSRAATIKDVAAEAGVSTATVSRVLAGMEGVSKEVRGAVTKAVSKLNYHPNHVARDLRAGLRKVIGVIIPDLQNPFLTEVVSGIESVLYTEGYSLLLGNADSLLERERAHLSVLRGEGVAGLILIPVNSPGADYSSLASLDIPVVAADRMPAGLEVDYVSGNGREGIQQAVQHLLEHKYHEIGYIGGPEGVSVACERLMGYQEALRTAGISIKNTLIIHSNFRQAGGYQAMNRLLDLPKPPRAIVIANNLMTLGALQAIHERGIRVPDEMAVIGFDDMPWATSLRPPLTAIAQPGLEIGRTAAKLLLERLSDPKRLPRRVILPTHITVRSSCGSHQTVPDEAKAAIHQS